MSLTTNRPILHLLMLLLPTLLLIVLAAAILQGCTSAPRQRGATTPSTAAHYCIGRLAITAQEPLHLLGGAYQTYWGDIDTWREDAASYRQRVLAAQAPLEGTQVRQLIKPVENLPYHQGVLIVAHEEEKLPLDPNVVQVTGFIHHDGTTLRFRKSAVSRLQDVTEQRAREILAASQTSSDFFAGASEAADGFCVPHGMIKLAPLPGWHETTRTEGKFMLEGKPYRFSLRTRYLRDLSLNDLEADNQRLLLAELAGGTRDSALAVQALYANASMLTMRTASGSKRIAEWRIPASGTSHSTPAVFLYIWPESDAADAGKDAHFMRWLDARPQHNTPLMNIAFVRPSAMQARPAPVAEESKLVYRMRLNYWGKEDAGNRHYIIRREGRQIDEGRSDAGGFTRAYNADYDETWGTDVLNK